jgi:hypothetical protein
MIVRSSALGRLVPPGAAAAPSDVGAAGQPVSPNVASWAACRASGGSAVVGVGAGAGGGGA